MSVLVALDHGELYCPSCETSFSSAVARDERCPYDASRLVRLAAPDDPLIGRELDARYTIIDRIAQGGMGVVYRARQHSVAREVAIKVVHANLVSDPEVIKRFLREAKLASQLSHPNTVGVLDFGQTRDGLFYLVMELIEGRTLDEVFLRDGVFDARRLVRIGMQICDALAAAQAMSIVHRDLKPSNIILLDNSRDLVKVLDFGLAKSLVGDGMETTHAGSMCGTPAFIAPERACGRPCDQRSDLYALGCILYLLGSGRLPFSSESVPELLRLQVTEPAPPMSGVPLALAEVVDRLLAKDPAARYQTAAELRDALEAALPTTGSMPRLPRTERPEPAVASPDDTAASLPAVSRVDPPRAPSEPPHVVGSRPATATGMHDLVRSETLAAAVAPAPQRRRRWWIAGAVVAAAGGAMLAGRSPDAAVAAPPAASAAAEPAPRIIMIPTPVITTPVAPPAKPKVRARRAPSKLPF